MAHDCLCFLLLNLVAGVVSSNATLVEQATCLAENCLEEFALLQRVPLEELRRQDQTCLERVRTNVTPGEEGQFELRVLNYDNSWHITCKASQQSLVFDPFFLGKQAHFFGLVQTVELQSEGWPGIPISSITTQGVVISVDAPDHFNAPSLRELIDQTHKVPVLSAYVQSPQDGLKMAVVDAFGYGNFEDIAALSTLYPSCNPTADGDLQFKDIGDFRVCYAGLPNIAVPFRTVLIASSCGAILYAPHGIPEPFSENLLQAISKLRVGKPLVAIVGTSTLYQLGIKVTKTFEFTQEVLQQIKPDAFYDTHRQEYFAVGGIAFDLLGNSTYRIDRVSPEDICQAFPDQYRGSPSRKDNPLQVPVYEGA